MQTKKRERIESLSVAKRKEWRGWGKDYYKNTASMARSNSHHPDYDTKEKVEALHDNYGFSHLLSKE